MWTVIVSTSSVLSWIGRVSSTGYRVRGTRVRCGTSWSPRRWRNGSNKHGHGQKYAAGARWAQGVPTFEQCVPCRPCVWNLGKVSEVWQVALVDISPRSLHNRDILLLTRSTGMQTFRCAKCKSIRIFHMFLSWSKTTVTRKVRHSVSFEWKLDFLYHIVVIHVSPTRYLTRKNLRASIWKLRVLTQEVSPLTIR